VDQKTKILRIIARLNVGGPAVQIYGIANGLNVDSYEHLILAGCCDDLEIDYIQHSGYTLSVQYINGLGRRISLWSDLKAFLELRKIMKVYEPDVIHTHTAKAGFLGRAAALTAFLIGYLVISWLMKYVQSKSFMPFVIYRVLLGTVLLIFLSTGAITA